jgi:hypothetical protein
MKKAKSWFKSEAKWTAALLYAPPAPQYEPPRVKK